MPAMGMVPFALAYRDLANEETRRIIVSGEPEAPDALPADEYCFEEHSCAERKCDCRRVLFFVYCRSSGRHVATISHTFDPPPPSARIREQTFLDPILPQSDLSPALLVLCRDVLLADTAYRERLGLHYRMFKSVVNNPFHPAHRAVSRRA